MKGTITHGLHFQPNQSLNLVGFTNVDWASYPDDRRSTSGYYVYLGGNLISWSLKKQSVVARSSTKSEYRALAHVTAEVIWLKSLATKLALQLRLRLAI